MSPTRIASVPHCARVLRGAAAILLLSLLLAACGDDDSSSETTTLIWQDEFSGPANTGVDTTKWIYDLGTGYPGGPPQWGTGEVETYTADPANLAQDGAGNLDLITLVRGNASSPAPGRSRPPPPSASPDGSRPPSRNCRSPARPNAAAQVAGHFPDVARR